VRKREGPRWRPTFESECSSSSVTLPSVLFPNCRGGVVPLVPGGGGSSCCCCSASSVSRQASTLESIFQRKSETPIDDIKTSQGQGRRAVVPGCATTDRSPNRREGRGRKPPLFSSCWLFSDKASAGSWAPSITQPTRDIHDDGGGEGGGGGTATPRGCFVAPRCHDEDHRRRRGVVAAGSDGVCHPAGSSRIDPRAGCGRIFAAARGAAACAE
jgi:hypothetical protein